MVAPPREAIASTWLTVFSWSPTLVFSMKLASRVSLYFCAILFIASSSEMSSQWSELGARYLALVQRLGLLPNWKVAAPLGHSVPWLIGLSALPWISMILPSATVIICPQPTAQ